MYFFGTSPSSKKLARGAFDEKRVGVGGGGFGRWAGAGAKIGIWGAGVPEKK